MALNITLVTYDKNVDFGIVACRRTLPQVQRFIDYLEEALVELEEATGLRKPAARRANRKKKAPARKKVTPARKKATPTKARRKAV
jgi:hypothetical protein